MRIHAIQTGTISLKLRQVKGVGIALQRRFNTLADIIWSEPLPIFAWAIEHPEGVIVIDTGTCASMSPTGTFPERSFSFFRTIREWVTVGEEIGPQLLKLGIQSRDVKQIILTHLHRDHIGGIAYFPEADVYLSHSEHAYASGILGRLRGYFPQHWPSGFVPNYVNFTHTPIGPFPGSYPLTKAGDVILVPTPGHTPGHLSVIVYESDHALFFAGDASYTQQLMLDTVVDGITFNSLVALQTLQRIRAFVQEQPTVYLPAHDPFAAQRLAERRIISPLEKLNE